MIHSQREQPTVPAYSTQHARIGLYQFANTGSISQRDCGMNGEFRSMLQKRPGYYRK
jgi:hypothetical protein